MDIKISIKLLEIFYAQVNQFRLNYWITKNLYYPHELKHLYQANTKNLLDLSQNKTTTYSYEVCVCALFAIN